MLDKEDDRLPRYAADVLKTRWCTYEDDKGAGHTHSQVITVLQNAEKKEIGAGYLFLPFLGPLPLLFWGLPWFPLGPPPAPFWAWPDAAFPLPGEIGRAHV